MRGCPAPSGSAHISLFIDYLALAPYVAAYLTPQLPARCHLLLEQMKAAASGGRGGALSEERLLALRQGQALRWLAGFSPCVPSAAAARLVEGGRRDFYPSRVTQNWRRLMRGLSVTLVPLGQAISHIQSWRQPLHSCLAALAILLLVAYPARVIAAGLMLMVVRLVTSATAVGSQGRPQLGAPLYMVPDLLPAAAQQQHSSAVAATDEGDSGSGGGDGDSSELGADEGGSEAGSAPAAGAASGLAAPMDPLTALRRQYDHLVRDMMLVQNVLDSLACWLERLEALIAWHDPLATLLLLMALSALAMGLWLLGGRVLVAATLLLAIRPPALRNPLPPPPANFLAALPTRSDLMT